MSASGQYLATLRLIPDDIILAIAARDFDERDGTRCVCGWAIRESLSGELGHEIGAHEYPGLSMNACRERSGGAAAGWEALYTGAAIDTSAVERAFVDRLDEIVRIPATPHLEERADNGK